MHRVLVEQQQLVVLERKRREDAEFRLSKVESSQQQEPLRHSISPSKSPVGLRNNKQVHTVEQLLSAPGAALPSLSSLSRSEPYIYSSTYI